jgi:arabinose-5-phosphate isomerase
MSIKKGKEVVRIEAEAIRSLESRIDIQFQKAIDILLNCRGRVIVTGMGKSGIIGKKIASTLTSTGMAALFLHPAEGVHGDLGAVLREDVVICISKSGNTEEILRLIPIFKRQGVPVIAMTGNKNSILVKQSDAFLDVGVREEACPFDIIPTSSTTAALVMGDALAVALFQERGFSIEDYAQYHPGGDIGRKLLLRVDDIMRTGDEIAKVEGDVTLSEAILEITSKRMGATCVIDSKDSLVGIITDGDLRRLVEQRHDIWKLKAKDVMSSHPKTIRIGTLAAKALHEMEKYSITQLIVLNGNKEIVGMVHMHDLLKSEIA